jgi:hypothetical protein
MQPMQLETSAAVVAFLHHRKRSLVERMAQTYPPGPVPMTIRS